MMIENLLFFPKDINPLDANGYSRPKETTKEMLKDTRLGWLLKGIHKHMEIKYLTVKDLVKKGDIVIEHIRTESMLADPLTKGLKPITFKEHVVNMGVIKSFDSLV